MTRRLRAVAPHSGLTYMQLTPFTKNALTWTAIALVVIWLGWLLGDILLPFLLGTTLAYVLEPVVERLRRWRIPRPVGAVLAVLVAIALIAGLFMLLLPVFTQLVPLIREQLPNLLQSINAWLAPWLARFDIHFSIDVANVRQSIAKLVELHGQDWAAVLLRSATSGGGTILAIAANLLLIPVVAFYLLLDWSRLIEGGKTMIPLRHRGAVLRFFAEADHVLGQYLRGQLLVMLILAVYYSAGLLIAGFDLALPIGIFTGLAVFVPYVGFGLGLTLALVAGVLQFLSWYGVLAIAVVYGIGQALESMYVTPKFVGESIGLHPLLVIFILLAFGTLFGFLGILLALPAGAILLVVGRRLMAWYRNSSLYA